MLPIVRTILILLGTLVATNGGAQVAMPKKAKTAVGNKPNYFSHIFWVCVPVSVVIVLAKLVLDQHGLLVVGICLVGAFALGFSIESVIWLALPSRVAGEWIEKAHVRWQNDLLGKKPTEIKDPKCNKCTRTNNEIHAAHEAIGQLAIGLAIGICPKCHSSFCSEHSVRSYEGMEDNKCPACNVELDFYWNNPPSVEKPWRLGPIAGLKS